MSRRVYLLTVELRSGVLVDFETDGRDLEPVGASLDGRRYLTSDAEMAEAYALGREELDAHDVDDSDPGPDDADDPGTPLSHLGDVALAAAEHALVMGRTYRRALRIEAALARRVVRS